MEALYEAKHVDVIDKLCEVVCKTKEVHVLDGTGLKFVSSGMYKIHA